MLSKDCPYLCIHLIYPSYHLQMHSGSSIYILHNVLRRLALFVHSLCLPIIPPSNVIWKQHIHLYVIRRLSLFVHLPCLHIITPTNVSRKQHSHLYVIRRLSLFCTFALFTHHNANKRIKEAAYPSLCYKETVPFLYIGLVYATYNANKCIQEAGTPS